MDDTIIESNPWLKAMVPYTIFTTKEDVNAIRKSEDIETQTGKVSAEFVRRVLEDPTYYEYAKKFFDGEIDRFSVNYLAYGDLGHGINYSRTNIMEAMNKMVEEQKLTLTPESKERYETLKNIGSFSNYVDKHADDQYELEIDGVSYQVAVGRLIALMKMDNEEFAKMCENAEVSEIGGIPKNQYVYMAYRYFLDNDLLNKFEVDKEIRDKYTDIKNFARVDFQAFDKLLETKDTLYKEIELDKDFHDYIMNGMPDGATDIEKAVFVYLKMCRTLSYDEEFYARNQPADMHSSIDLVQHINLDNKDVVCYEFNLMYAKFLDELGIKFASDYTNVIGEEYGSGHAKLTYRCGKFLVEADSVTSILDGDMVNVKLNRPLQGLKLLNKFYGTRNEFGDIVSKMYELVAQNDKTHYIPSMEELLEEYHKKTDNIRPVSFDEKIGILANRLNTVDFSGIDGYGYALALNKSLFDNDERAGKCRCTILRNNLGHRVRPIAIYTINKMDFEMNPEENTYYYFTPEGGLSLTTQSEIQGRFDRGELAYVNSDKNVPRVPGIVNVKEGENVREIKNTKQEIY